MGSLSKLQNGSDVRGVALEVEGGAPVNLTPDIAGGSPPPLSAGWRIRGGATPESCGSAWGTTPV